MKNLISLISFILFIISTPLSIWGQKKGTQKGIISAQDTLIMRVNLQDSTVQVIKLNADFVRFEKTSPQSFQINDMYRDTTTTDSLTYRKQRVTLQYDMFFYNDKEYKAYLRSRAADEPDIKQIDAEIERLRRLRQEKIREKGKS